MAVGDLRSWYEKWYAPNNAVVVVVGDVDPDAVYRLAKKYFGPLKPSDIVEPKPRVEVPQYGPKRMIVERPAKLPYLIMGYKAPVALTAEKDWEPYALEVLASILDGGDSARLASNLVRGSAVAASTGASYDAFDRIETLFLFSGTPADGHSVADLEKALREQIKMLQDKPVGDAELERVKAQIRAEKVFEQDSIFYQAMQIGMLETVGLSWKDADRYLPRIEAVTAAQVQAVARKYLVDERLTVAELSPQPIDPKHPPRAGGMTGNVR
jgi:zinc protease